MGYKSLNVKEEDRHRIIKHFESMTKEQLIHYIRNNLYFNSDYFNESIGTDEWNILIDTDEFVLFGKEE